MIGNNKNQEVHIVTGTHYEQQWLYNIKYYLGMDFMNLLVPAIMCYVDM